MATYYRPNLTAEQRDQLVELLESHLNETSWDDPQFDGLYQLRVKLRDCRKIST